MSGLDKAFGNAVRKRRRQLKVSQEELGFRAGLHRTYISQIERGLKSPSLNVISVLAKALGIQTFVLIQMAEQNEPGSNAADVANHPLGNDS